MNRLYFAYGSNLHPLRLAERAPSSRPIGVARLLDHALRFRKRSVDGSAKCDVVPEAGSVVHGALFEIAERDVASVTAAEAGYEPFDARVLAGSEVRVALTYRARPDHIAADLAPYRWYRDLVLLGARYHGLPADCLTALARVVVAEDPDANRAAAMDRLCQRLRRSAS